MSFKSSCFCVLLLACSCTTIPFENEPVADFSGVDPQGVTSAFGKVSAYRFEALESVVFSFFGKRLTGMGYLSIDVEADSYALCCMTPTGIKIFEITGVGHEVKSVFVPPPLDRRKKRFADAVAQDIRRTYFDPVPGEGCNYRLKKNSLRCVQKKGDITVEYTYAGPERVLVRKRFWRGWRTVSDVKYYNYQQYGDKLYPLGIVIRNKLHHYSLVIKIKQVYPADEHDIEEE